MTSQAFFFYKAQRVKNEFLQLFTMAKIKKEEEEEV